MGDVSILQCKANNLFLVLLNHKNLKGGKKINRLSVSVLLLTSTSLTLPLILFNADLWVRLPTSQK